MFLHLHILNASPPGKPVSSLFCLVAVTLESPPTPRFKEKKVHQEDTLLFKSSSLMSFLKNVTKDYVLKGQLAVSGRSGQSVLADCSGLPMAFLNGLQLSNPGPFLF